jgi:hypothetical protein
MQGAGAALAQRTAVPRELPIEDTRINGIRTGRDWGVLRFEACLRGSPESCRALMLESVPWAGDEVDPIRPRLVALGVPLLQSIPRSPWTWSGILESGLLSDLERQFGADAFGEFWRSTQPPTVAFQDAFGTSVERWVLQWARSFEGAEANLNVAPNGGELLLMVLYGLLGLALTVGVAARRRVA